MPRRRGAALWVGAAALAFAIALACAGTEPPRIETGPEAVVTNDGLNQVSRVPSGTLFVRRDYAFDSYEKFALGENVVLTRPGARLLDRRAIDSMKARFAEAAVDAFTSIGRMEVREAGPCVARVNLALVNVDLEQPRTTGGAATEVLDSFGEITLVLEIRDGHTDEPLLRYGQRRALEGGRMLGVDPALGIPLSSALEGFMSDFRNDYTGVLPKVAPTSRVLSCEQRARLQPFTPEVDARRELEAALAREPNPEMGAQIYASCTACHQPGGEGMKDGSVPRLAGQHTRVISKQLADIRAGNRDNPTMFAYSDESRIGGAQGIADVAAHIATLAGAGETGTGPGRDLERGAAIYAERCARCHGPGGEGDAERFVPALRAQHYGYLARQFQWIKDGTRRNANPEMAALIQDLEPAEIDAVLDYVSRLGGR